MKQILILMIALIATGCSNLDLPSPGKTLSSVEDTTTDASADIDCDLLIGRWAGEKLWNADRTSRWLATYQASGDLQIDFTTTNQGKQRKESYVGSWSCANGILKTTTTDAHSETRQFSYRIWELTGRSMHYQVVLNQGLGPKFVSERVR